MLAAQRNDGKALGVCGVRKARPQTTVPLPMGRTTPRRGRGRKWDLLWLLGRQDRDEWPKGRGLRRTQGCASAAGRVARTPQSRHAVRRLALPPPATAARASQQSPAAERWGPHAARHNGWQRRLSPTGLRCLVPESTALSGRSAVPASLRDTRRTNRNSHRGAGEMAPAATTGGVASAFTQAQKASSAPRTPRGRGGA